MTDVPPQDPFGQPVNPQQPPQGYPQQPSQGYPPPPPGPPAAGTYYSNQQGYSASGDKKDPFSITSMVTGIVGVPFICCWPIGLILAVIAIVFGSLSLSKIKKSNGALGGHGFAITGLVLGITVIVLIVALVGYSLATGNFHVGTYQSNQ